MKNCNFKIKFSRTNKKSECISVKGPSSTEAQAWNLAMFGNNRFFAFYISSRGIDEILPGWELASGLAFSESKMAALKSYFLITHVLSAI